MELMSPRHLKAASWLILAILVGVGYVWQGGEFALGVLAGGLVAVINFHLLHQALRVLVERAQALPEGAAGQAKAFFAVRQILRFFALLFIIYLLVSSGWVNILGLVLGLSTVVLTLILAAVNEIIKLKKKEANPSHGTSHLVS
ncbi:MAG: ATP synthase subunit I [Deltaproteobacteria bacterium]|nr:ATP synthase subunit I [Deltaproteobacteria bacterium]